MVKKIRRGVFETNSSSTHSLVICSREELERLKAKELLLNYNGDLIEKEGLSEDTIEYEGYQSYEDWMDDEYLETFSTNYTTKSGEEVIVFGKYGRDG